MKKQEVRKKVIWYLCTGFLCNALSGFLIERAAFQDQEFICGVLCGAGILLLLHGAYYIGINLREKDTADS